MHIEQRDQSIKLFNHPQRERKPNNPPSTTEAAPSSGVLEDEIPFAPEWR
jgi:hypothetical protein